MSHYDMTQHEIATKTGLSVGAINKAIRKNELGAKVITNLLFSFPEVSAEWFLRGEGPMLRSRRDIGVSVVSPDPLLAKLQEFRAMLRLIGRELDDFTESLQNQVDKPPSTP